MGYKLSEYHTGYRAFSRDVLKALPLDLNSDNFIFDNQMLLQVIAADFSIGEVSCLRGMLLTHFLLVAGQQFAMVWVFYMNRCCFAPIKCSCCAIVTARLSAGE